MTPAPRRSLVRWSAALVLALGGRGAAAQDWPHWRGPHHDGSACAPKGGPVLAVRLGGAGELDEDAVAWRSDGRRNPLTAVAYDSLLIRTNAVLYRVGQ